MAEDERTAADPVRRTTGTREVKEELIAIVVATDSGKDNAHRLRDLDMDPGEVGHRLRMAGTEGVLAQEVIRTTIAPCRAEHRKTCRTSKSLQRAILIGE